MNERTAKRLRVETNEDALRILRGQAEKYGTNRQRAYGLAMEFVAERESEFETYIQEAQIDE